jgi:hypothetical protein
MASDPGTTPDERGPQIFFGLLVAAVYAVLQLGHVVFGLFFALFLSCGVRGLFLYGIAVGRQGIALPARLPAATQPAAKLDEAA